MNEIKQIPSHWMRFKVSTLAASVTSLILAGLPVQIQASDNELVVSIPSFYFNNRMFRR